VILRGQLDDVDAMFKVEHAVRNVPGVTAIKSLLHMPGTPAPNKADALAATGRRRPRAIPKEQK